jgi:hypothetical protein
MHEASEIKQPAIVPQLFISEISQTPVPGLKPWAMEPWKMENVYPKYFRDVGFRSPAVHGWV